MQDTWLTVPSRAPALRSDFLALTCLLVACASSPPAAWPEQALRESRPDTATVIVYRSTAEGWMHRPVPALVRVDGEAFLRLRGGEYVRFYLPGGAHEIEVEYARDCELATYPAALTLSLRAGDEVYLEVVPGFGRMNWIYCSPFQLVPFPMPGSSVELLWREAAEARPQMGDPVTE